MGDAVTTCETAAAVNIVDNEQAVSPGIAKPSVLPSITLQYPVFMTNSGSIYPITCRKSRHVMIKQQVLNGNSNNHANHHTCSSIHRLHHHGSSNILPTVFSRNISNLKLQPLCFRIQSRSSKDKISQGQPVYDAAQ
nr:hypothetical protein BaRGS_003684 [Batillaria attramentaria]